MQRISKKHFTMWGYEAIAIRIKDGEFYFLGWDDNETNAVYTSRNSNGIKLDKTQVCTTSLVDAIVNSDGYNSSLSLVLHDEEDFDIILVVNPNSKDKDDYNIFIFTDKEWNDICGSLADGDYLIIIEN